MHACIIMYAYALIFSQWRFLDWYWLVVVGMLIGVDLLTLI